MPNPVLDELEHMSATESYPYTVLIPYENELGEKFTIRATVHSPEAHEDLLNHQFKIAYFPEGYTSEAADVEIDEPPGESEEDLSSQQPDLEIAIEPENEEVGYSFAIEGVLSDLNSSWSHGFNSRNNQVNLTVRATLGSIRARIYAPFSNPMPIWSRFLDAPNSATCNVRIAYSNFWGIINITQTSGACRFRVTGDTNWNGPP